MYRSLTVAIWAFHQFVKGFPAGELLFAIAHGIDRGIQIMPVPSWETVNVSRKGPTFADAVVGKIGMLWSFAKEHLGMDDLGPNPTREVANLHGASTPHPKWPEELCRAFEQLDKPRELTAIRVVNRSQGTLFLLIFSIATYVRDAGIAGSVRRTD
jgi:hypothetical protein